jgi:hypothetical protein
VRSDLSLILWSLTILRHVAQKENQPKVGWTMHNFYMVRPAHVPAGLMRKPAAAGIEVCDLHSGYHGVTGNEGNRCRRCSCDVCVDLIYGHRRVAPSRPKGPQLRLAQWEGVALDSAINLDTGVLVPPDETGRQPNRP